MTNDVSKCDYYQRESQNMKDKWACVLPPEYLKYARRRNLPTPINKEDCEVISLMISDAPAKFSI